MPTGYSGKSLAEKLGIKPGSVVQAVAPPDNYAALLEPLPPDVVIEQHLDAQALQQQLTGGKAAFVHCFVTARPQLSQAAPLLAAAVAPDGMLWLSWPKLAAAKKLGLPGDLSEGTLRELLLPTGLVDVKVCAVSDIWSGLKFLWRRK
jgi:hypothetical protein